jgi:Tfp pilus assembly protein PilF
VTNWPDAGIPCENDALTLSGVPASVPIIQVRRKSLIFLALSAGLLAASCAASQRQVDKSRNSLDLASDLLARGQDAAAENEAKKSIGYDPRNEEAHNLLGLIALVRAERNVRLIEIDDCLEGALADQLRAEASDLMRSAGEHFTRATELAPNYGEAWHNRAAVALYFEEWDRAIDLEQQALAQLVRLVSEPLARANLGWAFFHKGDHVRATSELLQATQRVANFCLGGYRLARVLFERNDFAEAIKRLEPLLANPETCPVQEAQYLAGQSFLRLQDHEAAAAAFGTCVQIAPRSCQARTCTQALRGIEDLASQAGRVE